MAQYTAYMNYVIFFQDPAEYAFAVGIVGSNFLEMAPRDAANLFNIPDPYPSGPMESIARGVFFFYPFTPGTEFLHPGPTGIFVDDTVASQLIPGQAGNPASVWPTGPDGLFKWSGTIMKAAGSAGTEETITGIPQRRWIHGCEVAGLMGGGSAVNINAMSRASSRTTDGFGYPHRGGTLSQINRTISEYRTGLVSATSWERFYVRVQTAPVATAQGIWRCHGTPSNLAGCGIKINTAGNIEVFNISSGGVETSKGTITISLNTWYKIDVLLLYASGGGTTGRIRVYLDGSLALSYDQTDGVGMNQNTSHTNSDLGRWTAADNNAEIDLDDWICADLPGNCSPTTLAFTSEDYPIDWLLGSHVRLHFSDSASLTNWVGGRGVLNQGFNWSTSTVAGSRLTSSTALATIEGLTDAQTQDIVDSLSIPFGAVAGIIGTVTAQVGATDGQLGYKKAGGAAVLTTINEQAAQTALSVAYLPSGMIIPDEVSPLSVAKTKSNDANQNSVDAVMATLEYIGTWGPEDDVNFQLELNREFRHNCRYANTAWGYLGPVQNSPVFAVGGTYVGNGTFQEVNLPAPCHFLWIRPTTLTGSGGIKWFGASTDAHYGAKERTILNVRVWTDFATGQAKFSVNGTDANSNQNAITYQYIAFCDPGMRFNICGCFAHPATGVTSHANLLPNANFVAEGGFVQKDTVNNTNNTVGIWYKGPGFAGNTGQGLIGTAIANFGSFAAGVFTNEDDLNIDTPQLNYSLWRSSEEFCVGIMCQMFTYTGDGTGARTIDVTPASGRFPLLCIVIPTGAAAFMRDPSHAGANSCNVDTLANSVSAITGAPAVDQISVGATLNVNGIVYSVFIIPGSDAGWLNGEFFNPNCNGGGITPTTITGINIFPEGGLILDGTTQQTILKDISGIYTLIPGKTEDSLIDRQTGQTSVDVKIPDPEFKTGYIGG